MLQSIVYISAWKKLCHILQYDIEKETFFGAGKRKFPQILSSWRTCCFGIYHIETYPINETS